MAELTRCDWAMGSELELKYHDEEWGRPVKDDRKFFEFIILEAAQAGLSWLTILKKREGYRKLFAGFDPQKVAVLTETDVDRLLLDSSIVRNRKKIESAIKNAGTFLKLAERHGSFTNYIWSFVDDKPQVNNWRTMSEVPAKTPLAEKIAKELKREGMGFMGPTVVYAFMQATGLVNDHLLSCFCRQY